MTGVPKCSGAAALATAGPASCPGTLATAGLAGLAGSIPRTSPASPPGILTLAPAVGFSGTHSGWRRGTARSGCPCWRPGTQSPGAGPRSSNPAKALAQQALGELGSPGELGSLSLAPVPVQPASLGQCCLAAPAATPEWASGCLAGSAGHGRMLASRTTWLVRAGCLQSWRSWPSWPRAGGWQTGRGWSGYGEGPMGIEGQSGPSCWTYNRRLVPAIY